jgi:acyl-coenzyme A synthetase/AMP-(fatty) acid ligase
VARRERAARPVHGRDGHRPRDFRPDEILRLIEQHRVTIGFGNPDLLEALTRSPRWPSADFSSVRLYITGGAPVPERLIRAYMQRGLRATSSARSHNIRPSPTPE